MNFTKILGLSFILFCIISCGNDRMEFDSEKWQPIENGLYGENYRKKMVHDLIHNQLKFSNFDNSGTTSEKVIELLGSPARTEKKGSHGEFSYIYDVEEKDDYGGMNLELHFNEYGTLIHWRLDEFWYRP